MSIADVYEQNIKPLPAADRLQLAAMILNNIPPQAVVDYSDEWSEEDLRDFTRAGWSRIADEEGEEENA